MKRILFAALLLLAAGASYAHIDGTLAGFTDTGTGTGNFTANTGTPDPGHAYEDIHNTGTFVNGTDKKIETHQLENGYTVTNPTHGLVIPESVGPLEAEPDLTLTAGTERGHLIIDVELTAGRDLILEAGGPIQAQTHDHNAGRDILITTHDTLTLDDAHLHAGRDVHLNTHATLNLHQGTLTAERTLDITTHERANLQHATLTSDREMTLTTGSTSAYQATLTSDREMTITATNGPAAFGHATLTAGHELTLQSHTDARLTDATLTAVQPIHIQSDEDVIVTRATLDTLGTNHEILLTAGSAQDAIFVQDARFLNQDETALAAPHGVEIVGDPSRGSVEYAGSA